MAVTFVQSYTNSLRVILTYTYKWEVLIPGLDSGLDLVVNPLLLQVYVAVQ